MNRSEDRGLCVSTDEQKRDAGFSVAIKTMMRRSIDEGAFADVNARTWSAEHPDSHTHLALGWRSFPFEDSRAALHPIRLPRPVEGSASLPIDPSVKRDEVQARTVGGWIPGIKAPQTVQYPIEGSLSSPSILDPEKIYEVTVGHE